MARFILIPGAIGVAITVIAFIIVVSGPSDYEFGPSWIGPWLFVATPTAYIWDIFHLDSVPWRNSEFLRVTFGLIFTSAVNFILLGSCGYTVWLARRLLKKAEQDAAANP
jgi:hypothetical protein